MNINYRELLKKYMDHVRNEEGVTFVSSVNLPFMGKPNPFMTDEKLRTLQEIEAELPPR